MSSLLVFSVRAWSLIDVSLIVGGDGKESTLYAGPHKLDRHLRNPFRGNELRKSRELPPPVAR